MYIYMYKYIYIYIYMHPGSKIHLTRYANPGNISDPDRMRLSALSVGPVRLPSMGAFYRQRSNLYMPQF